MRIEIEAGSNIVISRNGRTVSGNVVRVLNRPNADGSTDSWNFWDLEYKIATVDGSSRSNAFGRWKQNVDGGNVSLSG